MDIKRSLPHLVCNRLPNDSSFSVPFPVIFSLWSLNISSSTCSHEFHAFLSLLQSQGFNVWMFTLSAQIAPLVPDCVSVPAAFTDTSFWISQRTFFKSTHINVGQFNFLLYLLRLKSPQLRNSTSTVWWTNQKTEGPLWGSHPSWYGVSSPSRPGNVAVTIPCELQRHFHALHFTPSWHLLPAAEVLSYPPTGSYQAAGPDMPSLLISTFSLSDQSWILFGYLPLSTYSDFHLTVSSLADDWSTIK